MRLNKFISETGVCSRREADKWIESGRVTLNGTRAGLGTQVAAGDAVCIDGEPVGAKQHEIYIALNKPVGITSTSERHVEGNIIDFVGYPERIFPIGRLDKDSRGLILLTNHGDIVNEILRSEHNHEKEYIVTVNRAITDLALSMMAGGVKIMGELTKPCRVSRISATSFRMILTQGLNRQIRRMCSALGYRVAELERIRIMNIRLDRLPPGEWRELTRAEIDGLKAARRSERGPERARDVQPARSEELERNVPAGRPSDHVRAAVSRHTGSWVRTASQRKKSRPDRSSKRA